MTLGNILSRTGSEEEDGFVVFFAETVTVGPGEKWDAVAAEQLNFLCLLFAIRRERGTVRAGDFVTESGQAVRIHSDGHLTLASARPKVAEYGSTAEIKARVPTKHEAKKLMLGFKRRYPKLDA